MKAWLQRAYEAGRRRRDPILVAVLLLCALAFMLPNLEPAPITTLDCLGYFHYLPALFAGRPFDLSPAHNPVNHAPYWEHHYQEWIQTKLLHVFGIGPALSWLPWYAGARLAAPAHPTGYEPIFWYACAAGTVVITLVGLAFLYLALRLLLPAWAAWLASASALFASPLVCYASNLPFTSHPLTFCLVSILLWLVLAPLRGRAPSWVLMGLVCGWLVDSRPQTICYALLPLLVLRPGRRQLAIFAGTLALVFLPQMVYWRLVFGSWLILPQAAANPSFFRAPALGPVLFSPLHGLFWWHPLLLVGVAGLAAALGWSRFRRLAGAGLLIFASQVMLNAMPYDWWAGWSFGGRCFCDSLPLLAVGLGFAYARVPVLALAALAAIWWNLGLFWQFVNLMNVNDALTARLAAETFRNLLLLTRAAEHQVAVWCLAGLPFLLPLVVVPAASLLALRGLRCLSRRAGVEE